METISYQRQTEVRWDVDVAVIGGGIAGVCAACAAADSGASVALVERFAVTGGVLTTGGVNNLCGETAGQGSVFDEMLEHMTAFGAVMDYHPFEPFGATREFDHEIMTVVLQEMLVQRGVKLLLHTRFVDVAEMDDGNIHAVLVCGQSGLNALRAKQFIDCTGEAMLAVAAGCETMKGRDSDGLQLPMSLMYFVREADPDHARCEVPGGWCPRFERREELPMTSIWWNGHRSNAIKIKVTGFDSTDTESLAAAEIAARRRMMQVLDYHQRVEKRPWLLDHVSPIIGIREGRRVVGDYVLTESDVRSGRAFEDGVALGTFYLDAHDPTTDKRVAQITDRADRVVPPYHIPLRALTARDARNLWMAGRDLSADNVALSSARVATSGAMMGQATGIAAALAVARGCSARDLPAEDVKDVLVERGANLGLTGRPTSKM